MPPRKLKVKDEFVKPKKETVVHDENLDPEQKVTTASTDLAADVEQEFSVVLLRSPFNASIDRMLFNQPQLQQMQDCRGKIKANVKHLELSYNATSHYRSGVDEKAAIYDGSYIGDNLSEGDPSLKNAAGFFKSGRFYIVPIEQSYELRRKLEKPKVETSVHRRNKIDDEKLFAEMGDQQPTAIRVSFGKNETEWQKKKRESSAQYRQQAFDKDTWVNLEIYKSNSKQIFNERIKQAENCEPAQLAQDVELSPL